MAFCDDSSIEMIQATFDAYAPGSTPDVASASLPSPFGGMLSPSITALAAGPFGAFVDGGRTSPTIDFAAHGDDDLHDELSSTQVVPDACKDMDDALFDAILSSSCEPRTTPEWAKGEGAPSFDADIDLSPSVDFSVKMERFADDDDDDDYDVPEDSAVPRGRGRSTTATAGKTNRPRRGPGSRRKLKEEIRDELDDKIYKLVPPDKLRLPKADFQEWRESSGFPKLTGPERRRLAEIRRMILARVYAERNRLRKLEENERSGKTLAKLKSENAKLKAKVAKMEDVEQMYKKAKAELDRLRAAAASPAR